MHPTSPEDIEELELDALSLGVTGNVHDRDAFDDFIEKHGAPILGTQRLQCVQNAKRSVVEVDNGLAVHRDEKHRFPRGRTKVLR